MDGESARASENLDQDVEQMRSEGKGRRSGIGKWQSVCVCECVCTVRVWLRGVGNMRDVKLASVPLLAV